MQNSSVKNPISCILHPASVFTRFTHLPIHRFTPLLLIFLILALLLPSLLYAAPQMADYCYLPPFVTDPNTPPNIMIAFERSTNVMKRAYSTTYNSANTYYGFFDTSAGVYYKYDTGVNAFKKPSTMCTPSSSDLGCISGNVLNWALMSSIDVARKALVGFGWPDTGASSGAGNVFTYSGNFCNTWNADGTSCTTANREPISYGQWEDDNTLRVTTTLSIGGSDYTYAFCLSKFAGSNPTGLTVRVKSGSSAPSCTGSCTGTCSTLVNNGQVAMKFSKICSNDATKVCTIDSNCTSGGTCQEEVRYGIIQKYADKNQDYTYDSDAARFGIRRWNNGADKQSDILCDVTGVGDCSSTSKTDLFKTLLNAISKAPPSDGTKLYLGEMMEDIVDYFSDTYSGTLAYVDNDNYTQKPYIWSSDPASACRKSFAIFITSGAYPGTASKISPLPSACSSLTKYCYTSGTETWTSTTCTSDSDCTGGRTCVADAFSNNTCYAYANNTADLSSQTGTQTVRTYVVHTNFLSGSGNADQLTHASRTVGGGEYIAVSDASTLSTALEEAILNILSTSASASTVATLTTQTRESSTLTQAYFYPKREGTALKWVGYMRLLWSDSGANLREDTLNTGWLDVKNDNILSFFYDSTAVAYKARTYADADGDLKIDSTSCTVTSTKLNDNVLAIWNAQSKLLARTTDDRTIKVGLGNTAGEVTSAQMYDFTTAQASTLEPYWSPGSYCSNVTTRWCAIGNDCNYCNINTSRTCPGRADSECYYCSLNTSLACPTVGASGAGSLCYFDYGTCTADSNTKCSGDTSRSCTVLADCIDDYGTCTADTCNTYDVAPDTFTCVKDCDESTYGCPSSVIKYIRGFDNPYTTTGTTSGPGGTYRIRHKCPLDASDPDTANCPSGHTCSGGECKRDCSSASDCFSGETCSSSKCTSGRDITRTLKLGDIVYSTPRISPNSAVNGYDVTYKDTTYSAFVNSRIKGKCSANTTCPNTSDNTSSTNETCTSAVCTNDGYTPIVIVGANDGMVHAFKVSKIKDFSPAEDDCGGLTGSCSGITTGNQPAAFVDKPNSALDATTNPAPPTDVGKELWSYIPYNVVPYLRWYCSKSYCHIPMVDARFTVIDASIDYDRDGTIEAEATETSGGGSSTTNRCPVASTSTCDCMPLVGGSCNYPWRRLLVGAMGAGGKQITVGSNTWSSSVFVLDITNSASPKLLWEKPLPDGTLTTSTPVIIRLASNTTEASKDENGKWYLVIGSGPTSIGTNSVTYKTAAAGAANIYVFDLRNGDLKATISTGATGVAVGDLMAVDMDSDYQVDAIYFGTYGGTGTCSTTTTTACSLDSTCPTGEWCNFNNNKFFRLGIRDDTDASTKVYQTTPSDWDIGTVVDVKRPIYASPEIASDASGNIWLYFGTGLYLSGEHATATTRSEYLYGVKETATCWKGIGSTCSAYTTFLDSTNITFTSALATELGCFCAGNLMETKTCSVAGTCTACGAGLQQVVTKVTNATLTDGGGVTACDNTADTAAITCLETEIASKDGWKRAISAQKMFSKPFVAGGLVDFTSFKPTSDSCSLGGSTYLWSLHYTTGTPYVQPTIFACDATTGCSTATTGLTINASVNLGTGVPPLGESLVALPLSGDTYKVITQVSGGLPGTSMAPSLPAKSGYVLWIVK